jgi:Ran GTPase-activating protein (RanGAP) involved in mRNA processing and transport
MVYKARLSHWIRKKFYVRLITFRIRLTQAEARLDQPFVERSGKSQQIFFVPVTQHNTKQYQKKPNATMRLFLHGRSDRSMTLKKLELEVGNSSDILLSGFEFVDKEISDGLELDADDLLCEGICRLLLHPRQEVTLQNCSGPGLTKVIRAILRASDVHKLTIRYDMHRNLPEEVTAAFASLSSSNLRSLHLRGVSLTSQNTALLSRGLENGNLHELCLRGNLTIRDMDKGARTLRGNSVNHLASGLSRNQSVRRLDLEGGNLSDLQMSHIISALINRPSVLHSLNLRGNRCRAESLNALSKLLRVANKLETLNLSWQRIQQGELASLDMHCVCLALNRNTSLKSLILSENKLYDETIQALSLALRKNKTIRNLELCDCQVTDRGAAELAQSMPKWEHLERLKLDGHQRLTPRGAKMIIKALAYNMHLHDLVLPLHLNGSRTMQMYLHLNQGGRHLLRTGQVPTALWPVVLERADRTVRRNATCNRDADQQSAQVLYSFLRGRILLETSAF